MSEVSIRRVFCESLDRWVRVRVLGTSSMEEVFKNVKLGGKKDYKRFLIQELVVDYEQPSEQIDDNDESPLLGEIIQQELYNICVRLNPTVDIRLVTLPDGPV